MTFFRRFFALFRRARLDRDMAEEMAAHLARETEQNLARGLPPDEARYAARRAFGGLDQLQERERDARGFVWLEQTLQDLRHAGRSLLRRPAFTAIVVMSLSLGIGAGTAVFSLLNAVLLRALPVRAPHELRIVNWTGFNPRLNNYTGSGLTNGRGGLVVGSSFPYPAYQAFRDRAAGIASVFAFFPLPRLTAVAHGEAVTTGGLMVSGNFFAEYGASTFLGRPLMPEDDRSGAAPVAVITYRLWEQRFGLDPNVLGQTVALNQHPFTIVGVLPRTFVGPLPGDWSDVYVSFAAQPAVAPGRALDSANNWWVQIMARLAAGANESQVQAALAVLFRPVLADSTAKIDRPDILLQDGARGAGLVVRQRMAKPLVALLALVGVVMLIACANVAGLLLARGAARQHEFAIRAAIGAGRWRLVRQSLTESLLLGLGAGAAGLLLGGWGKVSLLHSFGALPDNFRFDLRADTTVLLFNLGLALLTALVFGLLPAWRAGRVDPLAGLKSRTGASAPRLRLGKGLVTAQVGLSVLLVVGAGLMVRTFINLVRVDPGFPPENLLLFRVDPGKAGTPGPALAEFYGRARQSLAAIPGVRAVACSSVSLVGNSVEQSSVEIPGRLTRAGGPSLDANTLVTSDGFFSTLGIPMLRGRDFAASDSAAAPPVAVINQTFAHTFFPDEDPLGRTFLVGGGNQRPYTIIGIVRDAKYDSLRAAVPPVVFFPEQQMERSAMVFEVRSTLPPLSLVPAARRAIAALNPDVPLSAIQTQTQLISQSVDLDRLVAGLCSGLAGLALMLACIGLYGLMACNVVRRTGEIGVRMALGATGRGIAAALLREAFWLAAAGLALGLPAALALARLVRSQLYGITPSDPLTLALGVGVLLTVTLLAAWLPARRASRVDPMVALRSE
jgi:predicted permease